MRRWTFVCGVAAVLCLVAGADSVGRCDATASKFCPLGWVIWGGIAFLVVLTWLVGVVVAVVADILRGGPAPSGPRCPACKDPTRPGDAVCRTCGEPLDSFTAAVAPSGRPPGQRRRLHRSRRITA